MLQRQLQQLSQACSNNNSPERGFFITLTLGTLLRILVPETTLRNFKKTLWTNSFKDLLLELKLIKFYSFYRII